MAPPAYIRFDNGPEMIAKVLRQWIARLGTKSLYIKPGSPWENGNCESFDGKLGDECLNGEIFYSLKKAKTVIENWHIHDNTRRPRSATGRRHRSPSRRRPRSSTRWKTCISLSTRLVQNIGQAIPLRRSASRSKQMLRDGPVGDPCKVAIQGTGFLWRATDNKLHRKQAGLLHSHNCATGSRPGRLSPCLYEEIIPLGPMTPCSSVVIVQAIPSCPCQLRQ
jgi:putative transposase